MERRRFYIGVLAAVCLAGPLMSQTTVSTGTGRGGSPHEKTTWTVSGATISVEYGRPFLKGRPESQMMPLGKPWRTGADEATVITSDKPLTFGAVKLAPDIPDMPPIRASAPGTAPTECIAHA